jgi:hypothetical protein
MAVHARRDLSLENQFVVAPLRPRATNRGPIGKTSYGCRYLPITSSHETKENTPIYATLRTGKLTSHNKQAVFQQQSHILICFTSPCGEERETGVRSIIRKIKPGDTQ